MNELKELWEFIHDIHNHHSQDVPKRIVLLFWDIKKEIEELLDCRDHIGE